MHQSTFRKGEGRHLGWHVASCEFPYQIPLTRAFLPSLWSLQCPRVPSQGHRHHSLLSPSSTLSPPHCAHEGSDPNHPARDPWTRSIRALVAPAHSSHGRAWCEPKEFIQKSALFPGNGGCVQGPNTTSLNEISAFFTLYFNCFNRVYLQV